MTDTSPTTSGHYDVARYLAIDEVSTPTITPAGRLLFLADTTGTPQVWTVDEPGGWPDRLTATDERVSTVAASPTDEAVVYAMDAGSDERDQLYHLDLKTGVERRLTDAPEHKHVWGGWHPDGTEIFFVANRADPGRFDVYSLDVTDPDAEPVVEFEGPGGWLHVGAVGPDGERLALLEPHSSTDVTLSILDRADGTTQGFGGDDPATYSHPQFDGAAGLYCVTDEGRDTSYVGRFDLDTGELTPVAGDDGDTRERIQGETDDGETPGGPKTDTWSVDAFAFHRDTGRLVYTRNEGGYTALHGGRVDRGGGGDVASDASGAVDDLGGEFEPVPVPDPGGVVGEPTFGPDGERVAVVHTAPDEPYGVWTFAFGDGEASELTEWTPVGTCGVPQSSFRTPETIHYETFDDREIPAYWTLPAGVDPDDPDASVPAIVDIHGGPEHQRQPWFYPTKQFFLNRGYAVLEPNVRGSSGYGRAYAALDDVERRMDSVRDVERAVDWLHDRSAVDDDRIVAYGRSYGGFMVLAAITEYPELWAAAVEFVGIADFETFLENTGEWRRGHREAEYGSLETDRELLREISPLHQMDRVSCPLFVQHGANDPRVPVGEAEQVVETAREQGVPVESLIFEDEGHHTTSRANLIEEFERIAAFLDDHV
ncbi:prolyl oligopeptidase family serine peptidase [Halobaculum sp. MBLA0147]|uniref:prolyl oligopeptidase family serine peptidase n=1 Tax=Halobaculum sp. MBLA0147 TaxID=3079934 RepID=UPI003524BB99